MLQTSYRMTVHSGRAADGFGTGETTVGWKLVEAAQRGDREAFGTLYGRYADSVSRFVSSRVNDRALAQDLTSETFLRALRRIDSVHDQGRDVGAWFTTIARNLVADHVKSSRHRLESPTAEVPERASAGVVGPEQAVIDKDTAEQLRRYVAQLSPDQQECLRLRFGQELSSAQTAAVMGRSELAVRGLRHRALGQLREAMSTSPQAVSSARETNPDPMLRARQAVAHAQQHCRGGDRSLSSQARADQLARWHTADYAAAAQQSAPADGVGVA
jgi:RNA polymerase sigma-70 factor (ECF subfamily)